MAIGPAALVGLMGRYLSAMMDTSVTLLEVHKLVYFVQEAGEPLRLRYVKAPYGPYAENLRHVLAAVNGHVLTGFSGDGDDPREELELASGVAEEASSFLAWRSCRAWVDEHPASRYRRERPGQPLDEARVAAEPGNWHG